ncbi:DsrE family protein [Janthinobacterium fluminis]|uniref:DsrE family protein n=1 Tax=Janthinobacterium fluminis TaxID=2987524 RepID=A0ABT5K3A4_9BURK|nr:DsrE family protein [Janthinobacterium fluminis]MDC8758935.1 DsrE family protein [Janthinobacterium fluminis]
MNPHTSIASADAASGAKTMLMVETRSPWESGDAADFLLIVRALLDAGEQVQLFLIQNGVFWLQQERQQLLQLCSQFDGRLALCADDMSLEMRGMSHQDAAHPARICAIDALVASMAQPNVKTIWHS